MAISTKDFKNLPLEKWNGTTVRAYVSHLNEERFGVPAVTMNVAKENAVIKRMVQEYGIETVKAFCEQCVKSYRPNAQYPTVNFFSMYSFMKGYELPKVMKAKQEKSKLEQIKAEQQAKMETVADYF